MFSAPTNNSLFRLINLSTKFSIGRKDGSWKVLKVNGKSIISNNLKNRFVINQYGKIKELPEADKFYINNGIGKFKEIIIMLYGILVGHQWVLISQI